jgi:ribonuclease III
LALTAFREVLMKHVPDGGSEETPVELATRLGLVFSNQALIVRALTHRSYLNEHPEALEDNERLEFLGDAVLDFLCGAWLYNKYPEMSEGELTRMRSALVRTEQLAEFARSLSLGNAMRLGRGEIVGKGRERDMLLCATFEALVGALYLEVGIEDTMKFIHPLLEKGAVNLLPEADTLDPKSRLQEWSQGKHMGIPDYVTVQASGPDHERQFEVEVRIKTEVYGRGSGHSKTAAARMAAQKALEYLKTVSN